jgi:NADH-quinone oxidoreductase subunit L
MLLPLILLGFGSIFAGYFFKETFIGHDSKNFWKSSIFFLNEIKHQHIPFWLLLTTPIIVVLAIPISYYYFIKNTNILINFKKINTPLYNFLLNKWYIDELYDLIFVGPLKKIGLFFWKKGDENTIDRFGPNGMARLIKLLSNKAVQFQTGYIYDYAFVMLLGLSALITFLILN